MPKIKEHDISRSSFNHYPIYSSEVERITFPCSKLQSFQIKSYGLGPVPRLIWSIEEHNERVIRK